MTFVQMNVMEMQTLHFFPYYTFESRKKATTKTFQNGFDDRLNAYMDILTEL